MRYVLLPATESFCEIISHAHTIELDVIIKRDGDCATWLSRLTVVTVTSRISRYPSSFVNAARLLLQTITELFVLEIRNIIDDFHLSVHSSV
jgi:hypothetical protein